MAKEAVQDLRVSVIFETEAILPSGAPKSWNLPYFNLVVAGQTALSPHALLKKLKEIEELLGRDFTAPRWAPRNIDLDILAYGSEVVNDEHLQIPHPELLNRPFLLQQMALLGLNWHFPPPIQAPLAEIVHQTPLPTYKCFMPFPQMVGIVNITPDSFSDGGHYLAVEKALKRIDELTEQGAAVIDLGAQSTRPGATPISDEEEWQRLQPVLKELATHFQMKFAKPKVSLDTFSPYVLENALRLFPLDWVNDVEGGKNLRLLQIAADASCSIALTHSLTVPASQTNVLPFDHSPMSHVLAWAIEKTNELQALGIPQEKIILDPGIGFGKTPFQSLELLQEIDPLKAIGPEILIGHSRKSFLKFMTPATDRDIETVGIAHYLLQKRIDYVRVHNVEAHQRSLTAHALIGGIRGDTR